ncbi:MAG TPA: acetyl-CoA C-acetyltransferase [Propylenella sp.]
MAEAFIYDAVRTPRGRGKPDGALHEVPTVRLAATALNAIRDRNSLDTHLVDDLILGCVDPIGEAGGDVARAAVFAAGYGAYVPGMQINRFCASGLDAVNMAAAQVMTGQHDLVVAGGVESMSRVGIGTSGGAWPVDPEVAVPSYFMPQGVSADLIATKYGFSRDDVDAYAVESQRRTAEAWSEGRFAKSVVPVTDVNELIILDRDEHPRPDTDMQSLAALKPAFEIVGQMGGFDAVAIQAHPDVERVKHVHHAGNSSGIVDGAAAVLVGNAAGGKAAGLKPRGKVRAFANIGSDPALMLTGPIDVTRKVLKRSGMTLADIDLFEINEAFAAVVLRAMQALDLDPATVNVNGGAIAMGHPLGATGAMIMGTALDELERRGLSTALVTLCIGAGMGTATIIERV